MVLLPTAVSVMALGAPLGPLSVRCLVSPQGATLLHLPLSLRLAQVGCILSHASHTAMATYRDIDNTLFGFLKNVFGDTPFIKKVKMWINLHDNKRDPNPSKSLYFRRETRDAALAISTNSDMCSTGSHTIATLTSYYVNKFEKHSAKISWFCISYLQITSYVIS